MCVRQRFFRARAIQGSRVWDQAACSCWHVRNRIEQLKCPSIGGVLRCGTGFCWCCRTQHELSGGLGGCAVWGKACRCQQRKAFRSHGCRVGATAITSAKVWRSATRSIGRSQISLERSEKAWTAPCCNGEAYSERCRTKSERSVDDASTIANCCDGLDQFGTWWA